MSKQQIEVWIVDDDPTLRFVMNEALQQAGFEVRLFAAAEEARQALATQQPAVLVCDVRLPGESGFDLLRYLRQERPRLPVIVVTAHADLESAVTAYRGGAFEYLPKPFDLDELALLVNRAAQAHGSAEVEVAPPGESEQLIGEAAAMQQVFRTIGRLSQSQLTALITGESGTGKELVARALHR
ncbi:MAG TPA: response regulator, partial [Gammaproteobacteria bacterium]|nr:response regulator [Gammaproteobacteria bacterium]